MALVLHNKLPEAVVERTELPQLFTTVTSGADGIDLGAAVPLPDTLMHPFTVVVAVKLPAVLTVIEGVVAPVLHNKLPAAVVDKTELPQLFTTVITGADGIVTGAAVPLPGPLVHPFTVVVAV